jgi:hypothetical protein
MGDNREPVELGEREAEEHLHSPLLREVRRDAMGEAPRLRVRKVVRKVKVAGERMVLLVMMVTGHSMRRRWRKSKTVSNIVRLTKMSKMGNLAISFLKLMRIFEIEAKVWSQVSQFFDTI